MHNLINSYFYWIPHMNVWGQDMNAVWISYLGQCGWSSPGPGLNRVTKESPHGLLG